MAVPSDTGIAGSRKIKLNRGNSSLGTPENKEDILYQDIIANLNTDIVQNRSNIVDSAFSNFVAKKFEEIGKEKGHVMDDKDGRSLSKDKKHHKHKKSEKHKKHKHKSKDFDKECGDVKKKRLDSRSSEEADAGGFFAKESFLDPGQKEGNDSSDLNSDIGTSAKSKKHKKHKKSEHKHKHKHKDKHDKDRKKDETLTDKDVFPAKITASPKNIFADKFEKQIESKLNSLKENLTRKHKALEDLNKGLSMTESEKKIKIMTALTLSDKYNFDEERKNTLAKNAPASNVQNNGQVTVIVDSGSAFSEVASQNAIKEIEDRSVKTSTGGNLTVQVQNAVGDEDGFRAMKSRKEREEESVLTTNAATETATSTNQIAKRPLGMKLGLKLSENSFSLISSGVKVENDPKKRNREEGEITDSQEGSQTSTSSSVDSESDTDGEIEDSKSKKKVSDKKKPRDRSSKKQKKRSRSKTPRKRRHSRSRSRSYDEKKGVWKSKSRRKKSRSRSKDRSKRSKDKDGSKRRSHSRERHQDRNFYYNDRYRTRRSRSRERRPDDLRIKIDKAKLREIAMRNALTMMGGDMETIKNMKPDQIAALKAGGKSVEELTNFCKKISEKDPHDSSDDEELRARIMRAPSEENDPSDTPFINHPFKVNPIAGINMNIRNARQLPVTSFADRAAKAGELRLQFPVSSGSQHKTKEDEWTPVEKPKTPAAVPPPPPQPQGAMAPPPPPPRPVVTATSAAATHKQLPKPGAIIAPPPPPPPPTLTPPVAPVKPEDRVFPDSGPKINISDVVSERLSAMRKLQSNPNDVQAMGAMYKSQEAMKLWGQHQHEPGQFTGSTGVKVLSQKELQGSYHAWARKDLFHRAAPVKTGIGKLLLQKMGWKEGTGLGKEETGVVEPLRLDIKVDRKGLLSADEAPVSQSKNKAPKQPVLWDLSGKHPVSALMELCKRKKWTMPIFDQVFECGPPHKKNFVFKVRVDGTDYQPTIASSNKKHAKAQAATVVLQQFGLIPRDEVV